MCAPGTPATAPASAGDALAAVQAGLRYLATTDAAALTGAELADLLRGLAAAESAHLAATAAMLRAFEDRGACADDGQISARVWLRWQTRITGAAAGHATAWSRRLHFHPGVATALATGQISPSYARQICDWTGHLPAEHRPGADQILLAAASGGADLAELAALAEEIRRRVAPPDSDDNDLFEGRWLRLTPHYQGHARLDGELTPPAAAALRAVLDTLGRKAGPEDDRTRGQREHDALEEACRRLVAGGLPDRAGQPTTIQLSMTLPDLLGQPGRSTHTPPAWDAAGPPAPPGAACDAAIQPIVTGHPDAGVLHELTRQRMPAASPGTAGRAAQALAQLTIAEAARLLSGPGGLAAWLRTSQLTGPAAAISLPLDIGAATDTIPPHIRRAVIRRDQHCRFGGCLQPPAACHVHHLTPRSEGGITSLSTCALLCTFHHLIAIHRWGWKITLNPDGTTTATHPHQPWRVIHSHAPPAAMSLSAKSA